MPLEVIEFGRLSEAQRGELEAGEEDPFDAAGNTLTWRPKDRHVALRQEDGTLVASTGFVIAELQVDDCPALSFVGIGGVFVTAARRGQGLGDRIVGEALGFARALGPDLALLFCHRDRAGLYEKHGFTAVNPPVLVRQPGEFVEMPLLTMWRPLGGDAAPAPGRLTVHSLPF
ncbi:MAG TPA: GNAT family N-acetyltransferase [Solirubrobacterales bacterium]